VFFRTRLSSQKLKSSDFSKKNVEIWQNCCKTQSLCDTKRKLRNENAEIVTFYYANLPIKYALKFEKDKRVMERA